MYAIIADSGRQFRVEEGHQLDIDYRDAGKGSEIAFDRVLAVTGPDGQLQIGQPTVEGAQVTAEVLGVTQGPKLTVQKLRKRKTRGVAPAIGKCTRECRSARSLSDDKTAIRDSMASRPLEAGPETAPSRAPG